MSRAFELHRPMGARAKGGKGYRAMGADTALRGRPRFYAVDRRRSARSPSPEKPASIMAQVEGSGTVYGTKVSSCTDVRQLMTRSHERPSPNV